MIKFQELTKTRHRRHRQNHELHLRRAPVMAQPAVDVLTKQLVRADDASNNGQNTSFNIGVLWFHHEINDEFYKKLEMI